MIVKVKKDFFDKGITTFYIEESKYIKIKDGVSSIKDLSGEDWECALYEALFEKSEAIVDTEGKLIKKGALYVENLLDNYFYSMIGVQVFKDDL